MKIHKVYELRGINFNYTKTTLSFELNDKGFIGLNHRLFKPAFICLQNNVILFAHMGLLVDDIYTYIDYVKQSVLITEEVEAQLILKYGHIE